MFSLGFFCLFWGLGVFFCLIVCFVWGFGGGLVFFFGFVCWGRREKDEVGQLHLTCSVFVNKVTKFIPGVYLTLPVQQERKLL